MKLLRSTKNKINKNGVDENVSHLKIVEFISVDCNILNNNFPYDSRVLYIFAPNKLFCHLLDYHLKILNLEESLIQSFHMFDNGLLIKFISR